MKGHAIAYSQDELAWIKANATRPRAEALAEFQNTFDRHEVTIIQFNSLCKRKGWMTGRTGQFSQGQTSHNAGKKGWCAPGSEKGWFKKGNLPHTAKHLGHERIDKDGYVLVSVDQKNPHTGFERRYVFKHRWQWEQVNGPVPDGHRLKCLDGNRANTDPSNWEAVPYKLAPYLDGIRGRGYSHAPSEVKPVIMATAKLALKRRELSTKLKEQANG